LGFGSLLGLDVGSSSVKLVKLEQNGDGVTAMAAGIAQIEPSGGDIHLKELKSVKALTDCLQANNIDDKYAVCGVCGPEVAVRYFTFPTLPAEEIPSAVKLEAEQVCPFSLGDSALDYQLIDGEDKSVCGVLVAATNKVVRRKGKIVKEGTLNPVLMDVDGLALLNCLEYCEEQQEGQAQAILNVGNTYTTLVISGSDGVPFVRDTSYAGANIIQQISERQGLTYSRISELLFGDNVSESDLAEISECFESACENLIEDVTGCKRRSKIVPSGGRLKSVPL